MCLLCCCRRKHQHDVEDGADRGNMDPDFPDQTTRSSTAASTPQRKKGWMSRLFSRKSKNKSKSKSEEDKSTDGSEAQDEFQQGELRGPPPTTTKYGPDDFRPSVIQSKITEASNETSTVAPTGGYNSKTTSPSAMNPGAIPPSARQSAFHGPPRFDWIDIEYTAATKIQSIHRRNLVMKNLEQQGLSTSAIRNRKRRRKAVNRSYHSKVQQHDETPSLFNCCSAGLAFGALTDDDDIAYREYQRRQYEEKVQQQQQHEDELRRKYLHDHGMKEANQILEVMEVHD